MVVYGTQSKYLPVCIVYMKYEIPTTMHVNWPYAIILSVRYLRLCMVSWSYCSAYTTPRCERGPSFWKSLFSALERGTEDFNRKPSTEVSIITTRYQVSSARTLPVHCCAGNGLMIK